MPTDPTTLTTTQIRAVKREAELRDEHVTAAVCDMAIDGELDRHSRYAAELPSAALGVLAELGAGAARELVAAARDTYAADDLDLSTITPTA